MIEFLSERFAPGPLFGWFCPMMLLLIPLVWIRARSRRRRPTVRVSTTASLRLAGTSLAARTLFILPLLRSLAILALIVALARPQAGGAYRDAREGIAIQMVLDVSGSMASEDFILEGRAARRLDAVKMVFRDFVLGSGSLSGRDNDLIGMTEFAMYADTTCPLTLDHGSLIDLLDDTDIPGWVDGRQVREDPEAGFTSLGEAIVAATDDLRRAGEQAVAGVPGAQAAKSRVMILLTDGANNPPDNPAAEPPDPIAAAKVAGALGIKIYTIGAVGTATTPQGRFGLLFQRRPEVDEPTLREIARVTRAQYFRATDTDSLKSIYDEIARMETRRTGERTFRDDTRASAWAMLIAVGLLMTEQLLVTTRYRRIP